MQTINISVPLTEKQLNQLALFYGYKAEINDPATEFGMMANPQSAFDFVSDTLKVRVTEFVGVIPTSNEETDAQIQAKQAEIEALQKQAEEAKEAEKAAIIESITIS